MQRVPNETDRRLAVEFDEKKIDAIFAEVNQCHLPGAAVGIAIGGKPVYRKGFGLANLELPVVLSPTMRLRIASITKHLASLAYLLLCEEGRAGIDDPIGKYLGELHPVTHHVTMRELMGHISGLRDVFDITHQFSGTQSPVSSADLLSLYRDIDDVNFEPGTSWIYSNGGYLMLSTAIERITGKSLEDVLRTRIFEPVGMYATALRRWETGFVANCATAHRMNAQGSYERSHFFGTAWAGEGGVISTVDDMLRWLAHMDAPVVGNAATWKAIRAPLTLANGTSTGYGLGLIADRYRGVETLSHSGGGQGGNAHIVKVPAAGLDVVIMVNRSDAWAILLAEQILDACLPGPCPVKNGFSGPLAAGVFRSSTTGRVIHLVCKDRQQIACIDGMDIPFEPDNGVLRPVGIFRSERQTVTLIGDPERPSSIQFSDFGNVDTLTRQKPPERINVGDIVGRYLSKTTRVDATIAGTEEGPRLTTCGPFGSVSYRLECLADGIWRAKLAPGDYWGGILLFDHTDTFLFCSPRTRMLRFRRCT
jgi:D-aminopeptidase